MSRRRALCGVSLALLLLSGGCGYTLVGRGAFLPEYIGTVAIPTFGNRTPRFEVDVRITDAVTREFVSRGDFRVVGDPQGADAVLQGEILQFFTQPVGLGQQGRAQNYQVTIVASVSFRDLVQNRVLFTNSALQFRQQYELDQNPALFADVEITAIDEISRDFARSIVSQILEGF